MSSLAPNLIDSLNAFDEYRGAGRFYRLKSSDGQDALALDRVLTRSSIDPTRMYVQAVVSNTNPDDVGDILQPRGFDLSRYELNPVWLWEHGLDPAIPLPIASAEGPDGRLDLQISETEVTAGSYFSQSYPAAVQIFQLIDEGIIRSVSVREKPLVTPRQVLKSGQWVNIVDRCLLEEISWCRMGVNMTAVRKCLDRNRLDGRPILEPIFKSLSACVPRQSKPGIGWKSKMRMPNDMDDDGETKDVTAAEQAKLSAKKSADADGKEKDAETKPADEVATGDADGPTPEPESMDPSQRPLGSQILKSMHQGIKDVCKAAESCTGPMLEHEGVKKDATDMCGELRSHLKSLEGSHAKHYPKMKSDLKSDDMDDEGGDDEGGDDSAMKSFLALSVSHQRSVGGVTYRLKSLLSEANITPDQKRIINSDVKFLERLESESESLHKSQLKSKSANSEPELTAEQLKEAEELMAKLSPAKS